jgi:glycosyltransferase involved in cell wall biosynthesis
MLGGVRIVFLANPAMSGAFYRATGPMTALAQLRGHDVRRLPVDEARPPLAGVRAVDVLHIHRYADERAVQLAREAKAHGAAVVWDNDDDMGSIPKGTPGYRVHGGVRWEQRLAAMRRIFSLADLVTTPSEGLAGRLRELGAPRVEVIENHIPDQFMAASRRVHEGIVVGWTAGLEHQLDAERIPIRATLERLLEERPDVHVTTFGLRLGLRDPRYRHIETVKLMQLADEAASFDIGIAPLADIPFNHSRSSIKLKEYGAAGVPWLASPIGPYAKLGEKQGGRLVPDDGWHAAIARLLDKERERRKLAKRAKKWAAGETLSAHVMVWEDHYTRAIARARAT